MATKLNTKKPGAKKPDKLIKAVKKFHIDFGKLAFTATEESTSPEEAVAVVAECVHLEMGMYLDAVHRAERKARAAMKKGEAK